MEQDTTVDTLTRFVSRLRDIWDDGRDPGLPARAQAAMETFLRTARRDEPWLHQLFAENRQAKEVYRDPDQGFILMGHFQRPGHDRNPHDHGPHWVLYGVYAGATDITTWRRQDDGRTPGRASLAAEETVHLTPGTVCLYPRGAIHSVKAPEPAPQPTLVFRFLSADLDLVKQQQFDLATNSVS